MGVIRVVETVPVMPEASAETQRCGGAFSQHMQTIRLGAITYASSHLA
jgi:hypothetical protein